VKLTLSYW